MAVTRAERRLQRKANRKALRKMNPFTPVPLEDVLDNHSYWITGYYWEHDTILIEPFCAVRVKGGWAISNLSTYDIEYYQALKVLSGEGTMLIYEDRVAALAVCEALEGELSLLSGFSEFMSDEELVKYLEGKVGGNA